MNQHSASPASERLIPAKEAFAILGMGISKGYGEVRAGKLKLTRNGRRTYVKASEVNRYIAALDQEAA